MKTYTTPATDTIYVEALNTFTENADSTEGYGDPMTKRNGGWETEDDEGTKGSNLW